MKRTLYSLLLVLMAAPTLGQSVMSTDVVISTDEDRFSARSVHTARIQILAVEHLEAAWFLTGELEHSVDPIVPRTTCATIAPIAFLAPISLNCEARYDYVDCPSARGIYRARSDSQLFVSDTSPHNQTKTKRATPNHIACIDPDCI